MENFDKLFPDNRLDGENLLKQTQLVMLRLLKIFDYLCTKHDVKYFLSGGTAIGAVRHSGFIPWDDDIDIGMTRSNYNKFLELCVPELPRDIFFQNPDTDKNYPKFDFVDAKLRDRYSSYLHKDSSEHLNHEGIQLDIFVYDKAYLPSKTLVILQNMIINFSVKSYARRVSILSHISKLSSHFVYCNNWQHQLGMLKSKFGANFITEIEIDNLIRIQFEDVMVLINRDYDSVLRRQYGDYMQMPPFEKRVSHHDVIPQPITPCNHPESLIWGEIADKN